MSTAVFLSQDQVFFPDPPLDLGGIGSTGEVLNADKVCGKQDFDGLHHQGYGGLFFSGQGTACFVSRNGRGCDL